MTLSGSCSTTSLADGPQSLHIGANSPSSGGGTDQVDLSFDATRNVVTFAHEPELSPNSFEQSEKSSHAEQRSLECCNTAEPPFTCQETLFVYRERIYAELKRYILKLYGEGELAGKGITARDCLRGMPVFGRVTPKELCQSCSLGKLNEILQDPRKWHAEMWTHTEQEMEWVEVAAGEPLSYWNEAPADFSRSTTSSADEQQCLSHRQHEVIDIDWRDPLAEGLFALPPHAQSVGGATVVKTDTGILVRRNRHQCRRLLCDCFAGCW
jgi:hypothetical protein